MPHAVEQDVDPAAPDNSQGTRASAPARRSLNWGKLALGCLVTLVALWLLGGGGIWFHYHWQHRQALADVQAEIDRIHAASEPITAEDMHGYHQGGPRSAEKAQRWLAAISALPEFKEGSEEESALYDALDSGSPLSNDVLERAEELLLEVQEPIQQSADAASVAGETRFSIEFDDGLLATTDHMIGLLNLARLFMLRYRVAVSHGDAEEAIESLHLIGAVGETLDYEPVLTSQASRNAIVRMLFREVPFLLDTLELTDEQLADLQGWLASIEFRNSFRRGLLGERAAGFHAFHYLIDEEPGKLNGKKKAAPGTLRRRADFRYYLEAMRELLSAADLSLREARQKAQQVDAAVKRIQAEQSGLRGKTHKLAASAQLLSSTIISIDGWAYAECDRDSAVAALAFRRYQLAHGKPPTSLAALCPDFLAAVPEDPFAKRPAPLRLVVEEDRFAIYSVGANLTDDGALLADTKSTDDSGIVVRLLVPRQLEESSAPSD